MFGNVTALVGWIYIGKIQEQKHDAHMLQACGLGSSQGGCARWTVLQGYLAHKKTPTPLGSS